MQACQPILRRRLYQEVVERVLTRIRAGEFRPGDQLPSERDLMQTYGVGRPAVREALQALERDGVLAISHGERARVRAPSAAGLIEQLAGRTRHLLDVEPSNLDHLKDARLFLETGLARQAARGATEPGIAELEHRLAAHRAALIEQDEFLQCDMAFHRAIAQITGNPIFPALIEAMFDWLKAYYVELVRVPGAENLTIAEHGRIVAAIKSRDEAAAAQAMHDHLSRANALYRQFESKRRQPARAGPKTPGRDDDDDERGGQALRH